MRRNSLRTLALVPLLALGLSGCVRLAAKPPASLLTLTSTASAPVGNTASGNLADALSVLEPVTDARLAVLRVPVQIDDASVAYLKKTLWIERPARLFQHLLAETLRAKGGRLVVEGDRGVRNVKLGGRLLDFGYDVRSRSVVVRFDALRQLPDGTVQTRRFERTVPGIEAEGKAVGPALNEAANAVAKDVADWVG
ncbi:ABC-type transport auxiliary lipoprotein family protein [Novosphingobium sp. FKTRR1]|uniref:ABC-type transport auxiliary lipoprotein family protein n=1 Tax=Novosphingobium sp. FKTRR1 TaxID=2879118 RepID=UPI001CEFEE30|nr:ABC-type transport auxiliary lipoprotein family protein [Novosphingobium sp. FKTRR1]